MTGSFPTVKLQFAGGVVLGSDGDLSPLAAANALASAQARRPVMVWVRFKRRVFYIESAGRGKLKSSMSSMSFHY